MTKRVMWALILMALVVIVLIFNRGKVELDLVFASIDGLKAIVFLGFVAIGVVIGVLLK